MLSLFLYQIEKSILECVGVTVYYGNSKQQLLYVHRSDQNDERGNNKWNIWKRIIRLDLVLI